MRILALTSFVVLLASSTQAAVMIEATSAPTEGLEGFTTWTVSAISDDPIVGFDFAGDGSTDPETGSGFFGDFNQLSAFGGFLQPLWANEAQAASGESALIPAQDTYFLQLNNNTGQGGRGDAQVVNASQSATHIQAAYAVPADANLGTTALIAQLVTPTAELGDILFNGTIVVNDGSAARDVPVNGIIGGGVDIPEPTTLALSVLGIAGIIGRRRR